MEYGLPKSLEIAGTEYSIRSDFREVLEVMAVLNDAELKDRERGFLALSIFYPDFKDMPESAMEEAVEKCCWFINGGKSNKDMDPGPVLMDWEKDFPIIISPVNRVLGHEARSEKYMHWWTFLAAFQEIGECTFAQVVHIRAVLKSGKTLEKSDREWYNKNRSLVDITPRYSTDEMTELEKWGGA